MTVSRKFRRPAAALVAVAATATVLTACSTDDSTATNASATSTAAATQSAEAVEGLDTASAQTLIRTAVDPETSTDELKKVLDTSMPGVAEALNGFAKGASKAGYTPDVYTVKQVKADGETKAIAVTSVKSPHASEPVDIDLELVKKDGMWKLAGPAVTTLTSMAR